MFRRSVRNCKGNMLLLVLIVTCLILVPLLLTLSHAGFYVIDRDRVQNTVEAAGLLAANDLSKIIINDSSFGYVSLSNHPPIGKGTCAADGEPLPVIGINTLVATIRQNIILAHELGNTTIRRLADRDRTALDTTVKDLNEALTKSLAGNSNERWADIQGNKVDPVKDVEEFLSKHLPNDVRLESVTLSTGWLEGGNRTTIQVPKSTRLYQVEKNQTLSGNYRSFVEVPAQGHSFTFAGLDSTSRLVNRTAFREADERHINSIVRIECVVVRKHPWLPFLTASAESKDKLTCVAYCQPNTLPDIGPKGALTLRFSGQPVPGLQSWSDFLNDNNFQDRQVMTYDVIGGDFPTDREARMHPSQQDVVATTSQQFAEHLYYWLRNGHAQPNIEAVMSMISEPFKSGPNEIYIYEFANDGEISRRVLARDPFPIGVTSESQYSTMADTQIQGSLSPIIIFRNNVKNWGTIDGGKHAGQPLAGTPLNWCELREFGGDEQTASELGKGRLGTQLLVTDPLASCDDMGNPNIDLFRRSDGKPLALQPRKSFYSGGLAVDIEIGGIRNLPNPTLDIPSKRHLWIHRKI
ncbi:MAG: hypothetical protein K2X93_08905 [Candidatus Obscuribacterales bacterium]|nr:hypothetical protein [Candidatus Obscuribacterales bacterium]